MRPDVHMLSGFYTSPLGRAVARLISARLELHWPQLAGQTLVGLGFASPYLGAFIAGANRTLALMPSSQGVLVWPGQGQPRSVLVDDMRLPLPDACVDRLLLVHAIEHSANPSSLLREAWRVLVPNGQLIAIVPNRRRMWSAMETTPFGHGTPYSKRQLLNLMAEKLLITQAWETVLMVPPFDMPFIESTAGFLEGSIRSLGKGLGGVHLVCARKQVYGAVTTTKTQPVPVTVASGS